MGTRSTVLALAIMLLWGCGADPSGREEVGSTAGNPAPAPSPIKQGSSLSTDKLTGVFGAFSFESDTTITVDRADKTTILIDHREYREKGGDFDFEVVRTHKGSQAGDTVTGFTASRVQDSYFTKGSGGPFVAWDDDLGDSASERLGAPEPTVDLLILIELCGNSPDSGDHRAFSLMSDGCEFAGGSGKGAFKSKVRRLSGEGVVSGDCWVSLSLDVELDVETSGLSAMVAISHSFMARKMSSNQVILPPKDVVSSRRHRPVKMVSSVLGGIVDDWGTGAPDVVKRRGR